MGLLSEMYFSAEGYKIALDINEHLTSIYRAKFAYGNCITSLNAPNIRSELSIIVNKLNELERKSNNCNPRRVMYIKVALPNGSEMPVVMYIAQIRGEIEVLQQELRAIL